MTLKKPPTKAELREQLLAEVRSYLEGGGTVEEVPRGLSGRGDNTPLRTVLFDSPREGRTYVNDLVADIDARRKPAKAAASPRKPGKPQLKTIYDDSGEPIRKIWVEE